MPFSDISKKVSEMNYQEGVRLGMNLLSLRDDFKKTVTVGQMRRKKNKQEYLRLFNCY